MKSPYQIGWVPKMFTWMNVVFLSLPILIVIIISFSSTNDLTFPPTGISLRWYFNIFERAEFSESFGYSLFLAVVAPLLSVVIGGMCSIALVRYRFRGRAWVNNLVLFPLMVPEVVLGLSLLILFSKLHWYNPILNILILHVILTLPYAVKVISSNLYRFDLSLEEAARVFGAGKIKTFFRITLPIIKPGIVSASIFAFVVSFGNFTATLFLIKKRGTLPIQMYSYITTENDPTVAAVSALLIIMTVVLILILEKSFNLKVFTSKS